MNDRRFDVVAVGILVADIFASPLPRLPSAGELILVPELLLQTGGCAANAGTDLVKLGARVAVVGKVGNDVFADFIRRDLEAKGLDVTGIRASATASTSRTVILPVVDEDRRFLHCIGANADLTVDDIDLSLVASARALYVGGFAVLPGIDQASAARLFRFARERGVLTVLDVVGPTAERGLDAFRDILPWTDVFLPNDDEARLITGESDPVRQSEVLLECGAGTVVVTMGGRGLVARTRERCLRASAFKVDVVDSSGGGDAFDAGFIYGLLQGWDLRKTLEFASAIGASACTRLGCTAGVFNLAEATDFLAKNRIEIVEL